MKKIPLSQGKFALVDDADYDAVSKFKWHAYKNSNTFYVARNVYKNGKRTTQHLHQFLFPEAKEVNHKEGNGLDNRRYKLQPCSHLENTQAFRNKPIGASSRFRGVSWRKDREKWAAYIVVNGKQFHLGFFADEKNAARAYDAAARIHFKFPHLNFP